MPDIMDLEGTLEYKLDELIDSLSTIADGLKNVGNITVPAPQVTVEAPNVTVKPAQITPNIEVKMPDGDRPKQWEFTVQRDHLGYISKVTAKAI